MCYAFVTYFPNVPNFDQCLQFDEYDMNCMDQTKPFMGGCEFRKFQEDLQSRLIEDIKTNCSTTQDQFPCDRQCATSVAQLSNQPCLQGRLGSYSKRTILSRMPGWTDISHVVDHFTEMCN
ncbi:uncharacterized protein LOC117320415 [Pecten maximus]|uniref:uncharacterized protein LOC117320415 n=1 Tax=Pecten maximus TaxID=6579 RepID=UPI0014581638|nr:uncharacterized protein LOC117320415 [Pecten maximus]